MLGLGLNYCVKPSSTAEMTKETFPRLPKDIRQIYALRDAEESGNYNPKLYLKSNYALKNARPDIEEAVVNSKQAIEKEEEKKRRLKKAKMN